MAVDLILDPFTEFDLILGGSFMPDLTSLAIHNGPVFAVAVVRGTLPDGMPSFLTVSKERHTGEIEARKLWPMVSALGEPVPESAVSEFVHGYARTLCRLDGKGQKINESGDEV